MCVLVTGTPPTSRQKPAAVKVKHCPSAFTLRHLARIVVRIMVQGRRQQLFPTAENSNAYTLQNQTQRSARCALCIDPSIVEVEAEAVMGVGEELYYFLNIDAPIKHHIPFHYYYFRHHTL